jgi:hypothetical protein
MSFKDMSRREETFLSWKGKFAAALIAICWRFEIVGQKRCDFDAVSAATMVNGTRAEA